jgi:O-antigen ligase
LSTALALALALLGVSVILPPEIEPAGRIAAGVLAAAAIAIGAFRTRIVPRPWWLLLPPAIAAIVAADGGRARVVDEAAALVGFAAIVCLGRRLARDRRAALLLPQMLALAGGLAAAQAIAQHHWAYPQQAAALRAAADPAADPYLVRLEAGRPSGPFSLPAALAGFLALTIPSTLAALRGAAGRRGVRAGGLALLLLQMDALWLTRSIGGALALAVSLGCLLVPESRKPRLALAVAVSLAAMIAILFAIERRAEIGAYAGSDPVSLRLGNWRAAMTMIGDHPLTGVGPGRFGVFYPRYLRPGMNETIHAHNTFLEIAACWGVWVLPVLAWLAASVLKRLPRARGAAPSPDGGLFRRAALASGIGFLAHNLIDFTFYLPGVALPAALLLGAGTGEPEEGSEARTRAPDARALAAAVCGIGLALAVGAHAVVAGRVAGLLDKAQDAARAGKIEAAEVMAGRAAGLRRGDPDPWAFVAQSIAANPAVGTEDADARRARGMAAALRAARLEPESAILHYTAALHLRAAGDEAGAVIETERALRLFPSKPLYRAAAPAEAPR